VLLGGSAASHSLQGVFRCPFMLVLTTILGDSRRRPQAKKDARRCPWTRRLRRADARARAEPDVGSSSVPGFAVPDLAGTVLCRQGGSTRSNADCHNRMALALSAKAAQPGRKKTRCRPLQRS